MLTHIVCWKYREDVDDAKREAHRDALQALAGKIDVVRSLNVGADLLHIERSFDTGLVATFDDRAALDVYDAHPEHRAVVAIGREIAEKVVSVDFLSEPPAVAGG